MKYNHDYYKNDKMMSQLIGRSIDRVKKIEINIYTERQMHTFIEAYIYIYIYMSIHMFIQISLNLSIIYQSIDLYN